jgi:hypothetical protein
MSLLPLCSPSVPSISRNLEFSAEIKTQDEFIVAMRSSFHKAPLPNKLLIKYLLLFLHHVLSNFSANKVDANGLATAWAPVFFPPLSLSDPSANSKEDIRITEILIENYSVIWENGEKKAKPIKNPSPTSVPPINPHSPPHSPPSRPTTTLLPNGDSKEVGKRSPSPVPHKRPNSALSTTTTKTKVNISFLVTKATFIFIFYFYFNFNFNFI